MYSKMMKLTILRIIAIHFIVVRVQILLSAFQYFDSWDTEEGEL